MYFTIYLLLGFALLRQVLASPARYPDIFKSSFKAKRFQNPSPDKIVSTYVSMARNKAISSSPHQAAAIHRRFPKTGLAHTSVIEQSLIWTTKLKIGDSEYDLIIDTGSSDTWVAAKGFQCLDVETRKPLKQDKCTFGPLYSPGNEFKSIRDQVFDIFYGGGQFLSGILGYTEVTLAGISITQKIAAVTNAGWGGDGISSGLMGFAYPSITNAFNNTDGLYNSTDPDNLTDRQIVYEPLFNTMYKTGKVAPVFSIAISRPRAGEQPNNLSCDGYLALGGLPPVPTYGEWARSPIQYVELDKGYYPTSLPYPQYQWYTITPDAFLFQGNRAGNYTGNRWSSLPNLTNNSHIQIIMDSGTTLNYLPRSMAFALAAQFNPPAVWNPRLFAFSVACDAIPPRFALKIGGVIFEVDPRDMIMDDFTGRGTCITGHNPGNPVAPYVIGDVFLKNVLVVFDVGAGELRFRSRGYY